MTLAAVLDLLLCPVCGGTLTMGEGRVWCPAGHAFDVARQGYVMLTRRAIRHAGDTAAMVAARDRVQTAGVFAPVTTALVEAVGPDALTVLDVGAGTAHHTSGVVEAVSGRRAIALDSSKPALRRAARAHERVGAVGSDLVEGIPVADGVVDALLVTFAPRNVEAFDRVLAPDGRVVVVTPGPRHLEELLVPLGMLEVGANKDEQLRLSLSPTFAVTDRMSVTVAVDLDRGAAADVALMGPAGFHATPEAMAVRASSLPPEVSVTIDVVVTTFGRSGRAPA